MLMYYYKSKIIIFYALRQKYESNIRPSENDNQGILCVSGAFYLSATSLDWF